MIFLYEWTGDRFPQANQTERIKLSLAAYNTGYGRVSRAGGMPKNSSRGYAQWIFTSYNKTRDYIDRAVEEARQKSKSAPNNPIQREYDVSTVDKAKKFLANTPGATMIDGIKKGHDLRSRFGNGNLHNHKGLLKHLNDGNPEHQMMVEAADAWNMMNDAFKKDFGFDLPIRDDAEGRTYRRLSQQKNGSLSAKIGTSRHGDGTAFDAAFHKDAMLSNRLVFARQKKIIKWLRNNAYIYGFVQPEWALLGASSKYEVWHWEFWGEKAVDQQWKNMRWYMDGNRNHNDGYTPDAKMREIFKKAFSD